jgi:hypothetical protein
VRDHLHGGPEVLAAALLADDVEVDAAGRDVVRLRERPVDEALVVAEVEVGLGPVVGDEHLAVLERRHGARVDVQVRVELERRDRETALHQQPRERRGCDPLAEGRDDAAGDEHVLRRRRGRGRGAHAGGWKGGRRRRRHASGRRELAGTA